MSEDNIVPLNDQFTVNHRGQKGIVRYSKGKYSWAAVVDKRYSVKGSAITVAEARKQIESAIDGLIKDTDDEPATSNN